MQIQTHTCSSPFTNSLLRTSLFSCCRCCLISSAPRTVTTVPWWLGLEATLHVLPSELAGSRTSPGKVLAFDDVRLASGLNSRIGSGHSAVGACVMRHMRAVSGTLLTGRSSLPRNELMRVDLPANQTRNEAGDADGDMDENQASLAYWRS